MARVALRVFIPTRLVNPTNRREHWATRAARVKRQRQSVASYVRDALWSRRDLADLATPKRIALHAHVWRRFDDDGLVASVKACRDGLIGVVIQDDGPASGHVFERPTQEVNRKALGVWITVEALAREGT